MSDKDKRQDPKNDPAHLVTGKLFVMCEQSEMAEAEGVVSALPKDDPLYGAKLITEMPLARLVEEDGLCCIVRKGVRFVDDPRMGRRPTPGPLVFTPVHLVAEHWDADSKRGSGRVRSAGFLDALGKTIVPATIKRNDPKRDEDAFRISYA